MKAIIFPNPIFSDHHRHYHDSRIAANRRRAKLYVVNVGRGTDDNRNYKGKLVDENMIVLRMRMKELEMVETGSLPPSVSENWMEWEKKYYEDYNKDVCEAMGMLQMCLMSTRPSLVLGALALLVLSVPLSSGVVIYSFIRLVKLFL